MSKANFVKDKELIKAMYEIEWNYEGEDRIAKIEELIMGISEPRILEIAQEIERRAI